ncbi:MAG: PqqD family protein [Spirochaetota bacterium]|nr:PqqD family protein [Spirochaetota bacterium]
MNMDYIPIPCGGFAIRDLGDEIIFVAESGDEMHSLDETGMFIWKNINGRNSLLIILNKICDEYEVDKTVAENDLKNFINELHNKGILTLKGEDI